MMRRSVAAVAFVVLAAACASDGSVGPPPYQAPTSSATGGPGTDAPSTIPAGIDVKIDPDPVVGFAESVGLVGGRFGELHVVTSADDRGEGTYRAALQAGDRTIVFDPSLDGATIDLESDVDVDGSNITIDASGIDITVSGYATKFSGTQIVVAGLRFEDNTANGDEDALTFRSAGETQIVGVYGNTFRTASDGLLDLIWNGGNDVYATVCGNAFLDHDKAMLVHSGQNSREGGRYHVTLCRNLWKDVEQRAPLSRDADVHQVNDVFVDYGAADGDGGGSKAGSGRAGESSASHLLQGNIATPRTNGDTTWSGATVTNARAEFAGPSIPEGGRIRIEGSLLRSSGSTTATQTEHDAELVDIPDTGLRPYVATDDLAAVLSELAGTCPAGPAGPGPDPCAWPRLVQAGRLISITTDASVDRVDLYLGDAWIGRAESDDGLDWRASPDLSRVVVGRADLRAVATDVRGQLSWSEPLAAVAV